MGSPYINANLSFAMRFLASASPKIHWDYVEAFALPASGAVERSAHRYSCIDDAECLVAVAWSAYNQRGSPTLRAGWGGIVLTPLADNHPQLPHV